MHVKSAEAPPPCYGVGLALLPWPLQQDSCCWCDCSSWQDLLEDLVSGGIAGQLPADVLAAGATDSKRSDVSGASAAAEGPAGDSKGTLDTRSTAGWLWRLAREVQQGQCDLPAQELRQAQRVLRLRLVRLRHD
jgi:hypothetical protein